MEKESSYAFDYTIGFFFSCFSPLTMFHVYFSTLSTAYNFPPSKPHYHLVVIQRRAETAMKICWCVRGKISHLVSESQLLTSITFTGNVFMEPEGHEKKK